MLRQILSVLSSHVGAVPNPISAGTRLAWAMERIARLVKQARPKLPQDETLPGLLSILGAAVALGVGLILSFRKR